MRIISDIKYIARTYRAEIWVLFGSFLFAAIGDLRYGNAAGAEASLIGTVLAGVSNLFFTVFLIMVLFRLIFRMLHSDKFYELFKDYPRCNDPEIKSKVKKT